MSRGRLIVFEGPEGAGKTTQVARLAARLESAGIDAVAFREPGGTKLGDLIRDTVLDPSREITDRAEALLFMASRAEIVAERILPSLNKGSIVLLDRFFLSTYAYQIAGRGLPEDAIRAANSLATGGLVPDLTILLELPADAGLSRAASRGPHDRIERTGDVFHAKVSSAFAEYATHDWQDAHPECGPIVSIPAAGGVDDVEARIISALAAALPERFAVIAETVAT